MGAAVSQRRSMRLIHAFTVGSWATGMHTGTLCCLLSLAS